MYCNHCGNWLGGADRFCPRCGAALPVWIPSAERPQSPIDRHREGEIGRNLFAILASVLILLGVGIFIASIYQSIPVLVKVLIVYALGFAMLGVGLLLYRRNTNYFWLGIASCGLAELLICIFASYSYCGIPKAMSKPKR